MLASLGEEILKLREKRRFIILKTEVRGQTKNILSSDFLFLGKALWVVNQAA